MKRMNIAGAVVLSVALLTPMGASAEENLFEEAGHSLARSRFVTVHYFPSIEIALEADDIVLVESVDHPAKSLAMRLDGETVAADCRLNESKDRSYSYTYGHEKDDDDDEKTYTGTTTNISHVTYYSACQFPEGTTSRATEARSIVVQLAMPKGTTKPHELSAKARSKFQTLDK